MLARHRRKQHNKGGGGLQLSARPNLIAAALGQPWALAELDRKQPWLTNTPLWWPDEQ